MSTTSNFDNTQVNGAIDKGVTSNSPCEIDFEPHKLYSEDSLVNLMAAGARSNADVQKMGFPTPILEPDSDGPKNSMPNEVSGVGESSDTKENYCAAVDDGPRSRINQQLDGPVVVPEPAEAGNAFQIIELIESGNLQNPNFTLTAQGAEAIRAAIANRGFFQSEDGRTSEVQNYVNQFLAKPGISLHIDRDLANANTLMGSRPQIVFRAGNVTSRIPISR